MHVDTSRDEIVVSLTSSVLSNVQSVTLSELTALPLTSNAVSPVQPETSSVVSFVRYVTSSEVIPQFVIERLVSTVFSVPAESLTLVRFSASVRLILARARLL